MTAVAARRDYHTTPADERDAVLARIDRLRERVGQVRSFDDTTELHVHVDDDREATAEALARLRRLEVMWRVRGREGDV